MSPDISPACQTFPMMDNPRAVQSIQIFRSLESVRGGPLGGGRLKERVGSLAGVGTTRLSGVGRSGKPSGRIGGRSELMRIPLSFLGDDCGAVGVDFWRRAGPRANHQRLIGVVDEASNLDSYRIHPVCPLCFGKPGQSGQFSKHGADICGDSVGDATDIRSECGSQAWRRLASGPCCQRWAPDIASSSEPA